MAKSKPLNKPITPEMIEVIVRKHAAKGPRAGDYSDSKYFSIAGKVREDVEKLVSLRVKGKDPIGKEIKAQTQIAKAYAEKEIKKLSKRIMKLDLVNRDENKPAKKDKPAKGLPPVGNYINYELVGKRR